MSNAITFINKRFAVKCLAFIFNLSNLRTTILHMQKIKVARCEESCTVFIDRSISTHGIVVNLVRQVVGRLVTWVQL